MAGIETLLLLIGFGDTPTTSCLCVMRMETRMDRAEGGMGGLEMLLLSMDYGDIP